MISTFAFVKDSTTKFYIEKPAVSTKSLLAKKKEVPFESWPAFFLFCSFVIVVFLRSRSYKESAQIVQAFFSFKASRQLEREEYRLNKIPSILLSLLFVSSLSLFLVNLNDYYQFITLNISGLKLYGVFFVSLLVIYVLKFFFLAILAWLTKAENQISEYVFTVFITNKGLGVFLFPVLVSLEYIGVDARSIIFVGFFICLLFYVLRLVRGTQIALSSSYFSFFHLFLYLCTLEIFPLLVLMKVLVSRF